MLFDDAMPRIHAITNTRTQVELAAILGIRQSSISDAKRRQAIPDSWLMALYRQHGANPDWITTGQGRPYLTEDTTREVAGVPILTKPATPTIPPTLDDLLAPARAMVGPGSCIMIVPAGSRVAVETPQATYTMDDLEFVRPVQPLAQLPGRAA